MKKQTAVEWLEDKIQSDMTFMEILGLINQAKAMEKENYKETWETAHQAGRFEGKGIAEENWQTFDEFYEETFKSE